jgi:glyoxylase-like metal-dependent hydrolase (beta-lactamase superfamily II)
MMLDRANKPPDTAMRNAHPHRRAVLAGLSAALVTPGLPAGPARAAIPPFRGQLGSFEISVISDGTLSAPLSFMLPDTPATEAAKLFAAHGMPPDGLPPQTNVTLVNTGGELVLIDAGSGPKFQPTAGKLSENLESAGIDPKKISKVVFTHGHADHLWGAIDDFDDAERFPNARYVISGAEWDFWTHPDTPSRVPDWLKGMAVASARILKQIEKKIERRGAGDTVAPGMIYVGTPGHTPGHMAVGVENGGQRLLIAGDVFNNNAVSFAKPEWRVGGDFDRDQGITTRKQLLDQLATDRIPLIGFHLSWPGYGMVERRGTAYLFVPV